ncbi:MULTISPECIES: SDR family oxidoreductase [unclassified Streptomyces]|uniref:SDR family oxidoreductase n=1 Tax=unclassified Streptomyces TaxID=2593676 RepID=UPI002E2B905D|nr:NAD(P)H-binding protein [Streptomyces sp. NBC_00223]
MTHPSPPAPGGSQAPLDAVTGAFGYSGAAIADRLQAAGRRVRTLTGHPDRAPAGSTVEVRPLDFHDPAALTDALRGTDTLYNTYWVRFGRGALDHRTATARSRTLFRAAADAGVRRVVHVSITHPAADSPYPYFREKARTEQALADVGIPYSVLRPAILFGGRGAGRRRSDGLTGLMAIHVARLAAISVDRAGTEAGTASG